MCEFCLQHGEGKKWYLQVKNYSDDLLNDIRRRRLIENFSNPDALARDVKRIEKLNKAPRFIRGMIRRIVTRKMKKDHLDRWYQ